MDLKIILNTSWRSPAPDILVLLLLIWLTIIVEVGGLYLYLKYKNAKGIAGILAVVVVVNMVSGFLGFIIGVIAGY